MTDPVGSFSLLIKIIFLTGSSKFLGYFIECNGDSLGKYWSCKAQADLKIVNHKDPSKSLTRSITHLFYCKRSQYGYEVWQYRLWSFQGKLERFLARNQL